MPKSLYFPGDSGVNGRYQEQVGEWGRRPYPTTGLTDVVPPNATSVDPSAGYGYDAALGFWVPISVSGGYIVEKFSELIANHLAGLLNDTHELNETADSSLTGLSSLLELVNTRYGANQMPYLWNSMLNAANAIGFRKILNVDAGTYTAVAAGATTISYTGVNLANVTCGVVWNVTDHTLHGIVSVTNPAGATPGVITLDRPINTAAAVLYVPYASLPHAYNSAADALQTLAVVGDPPRINGPAQFIAITGAAVVDGTYQYILPCALYGREQIQIRWASAGTTTFQFRSYGKIDNTIAWPAAGAIVAGQCIDSLWQYGTGSLAFNSPPAGGAATNVISARLQDPHGFDSIAIEMIIATQSATSTVTAFVRLTGGTA
jgi:hypothetical protein